LSPPDVIAAPKPLFSTPRLYLGGDLFFLNTLPTSLPPLDPQGWLGKKENPVMEPNPTGPLLRAGFTFTISEEKPAAPLPTPDFPVREQRGGGSLNPSSSLDYSFLFAFPILCDQSPSAPAPFPHSWARFPGSSF